MICRYIIFTFASLFLIIGCDDSIVSENEDLSIDSLPSVSEIKVDVVETVNSAFQKTVYADADDSAYEHVVRFDKNGIFHWNNMPAALGDPIEVWVLAIGEPDRTYNEKTYIWDDLGVLVYTAGEDKILKQPSLAGTVSGFVVTFDDRYDDLDQYSIGRNPDPGSWPIGYFTGLIRFGDAWIDRDRKVKEFLDYSSTRTLEDSYDRSLVFRDIYTNGSGEKFSFSITQGLSSAFPEGPDNVSASMIR